MEPVLLMLSLLILISLLCLNKLGPCHAIDVINSTQSLTGNQTLVSAGGVFELGFFKPGKSERYYIGIWYKQVSPQTVIWVANRYSPVSDRFSSELKISDDGELALFDGGANDTTWSKSTYLSYTYNSSSSVSWTKEISSYYQLMGRRLLLHFHLLRSGRASTSLGIPGFLVARLDSTRLLDQMHFSLHGRTEKIPLQTVELNFVNNFVYVDGKNERYITFSEYNRTQIDKIVEEESDRKIQQLYSMHKSKYSNDYLLSRYVVDAGGLIQLLIWLDSAKQWMPIWKYPRSKCGIGGYYCGAYGSCTEKSSPVCHCLKGFVPRTQDDYSSDFFYSGCYRRSPLQCQNPDWFLPYYNVRLPDYPKITSAASSQDCETACFGSCSCNAYSYDEKKQCFHWYGLFFNLQEDVPNGTTIYIKLAASEFSSSDKNNKFAIMIGSVVGSIVLLLVLVLYINLRWRDHIMPSPKNLMEGFLAAFTYRHLKIYTKNFSCKLGEGGFGSVYKGTLPDSSVVAVKKLESINFRRAENHKQFLAEVRTLGAIQHLNLVGLRGFSSDNNTMMLVYDYMPNGSVASHLFKGNDDSNILDWKMRYNIALGTARGLAYIHEKCRECIIHCDIKPDNVLLDSEFQPKVADFGMAKLFGRDFSRVITTLRGTIGYLAPEWISGEAITAKADVYSYGMVLLELVSGMRNSQRHVCVGHYFPVWVANVLNEGGNVADLLDPKLQGNADVEELERVCRVGVWCIQDDESQRPTMSQVVYFLEQVLEVNIPPVPRILQRYIYLDPDN
ncbi:G-type lectin S-receptor-like serine/threonine-protein kinase At2g19130 [Linum perenne]